MAYTQSITCFLYRGIKGYNPPDFYCNIGSKELSDNFLSNPYYSSACKYVIDASLGKVTVNTGEQNSGKRVYPYLDACDAIVIRDEFINDGTAETSQYCVGKVIQRKLVARETYEFLFSVDWYTSSALNYWMNSTTAVDGTTTSEYPALYATNILYRRTPYGRFKTDAEGFTPKTRNIQFMDITAKPYGSSTKADHLFNGTVCWGLVCYACEGSDGESKPMWFLAGPYDPSNVHAENGAELSPLKIITDYNRARIMSDQASITIGTFNPKLVLYYGCFMLSMPAECFPYHWVGSYSPVEMLTIYGVSFQDYQLGDGNKIKILYSVTGYRDTILFHDKVVPTDTDDYYIADVDGLPLFKYVPYTEMSGGTYSVYFNPDINSPSLTFVAHRTIGISEQRSFTIMARPLVFMADQYAIYNAEQRVYNQEMRSLAATTSLVNGLTGAVSEGAMMNAFSRTEGTSKGIIGGGVAAAGSVINYAYTELYANKKQTEIEDKYAKNQADTLVFSSDINCTMNMGGLIHEYYDDETKAAIDNYHKKFSYKDDTVTAAYLWNLTGDYHEGYIQADVMMAPGFRKEVDQYVQKMFSYGVYISDPVNTSTGE